MPYALRSDESLERALSRVATEQIDRAAREIRAALSADDRRGASDRAVHETRKSCKRLRALLRLFRPGLGAMFSTEDAAIRDTARGLAPWRDRGVLAARAAEFLGRLPQPETPAADGAPTALRAALERLLAVRDRATSWEALDARRSAVEGARRIYRGALRRGSRLSLGADPNDWHEWRKLVKHHAYHAELVASLHPLGAPYAKAWAALAETLGDEHDLSMLMAACGPGLALADRARLEERRRSLRIAASERAAALGAVRPRTLASVLRDLLPA